jgi:hypothetical protein
MMPEYKLNLKPIFGHASQTAKTNVMATMYTIRYKTRNKTEKEN